MPGFLGSEREFQAAYGRPILQSRDAKSSTKDKEAGMWLDLVTEVVEVNYVFEKLITKG